MSPNIGKHLSVACFDKLICFTVFPLALCCSAELPPLFPLLSFSSFFLLSSAPPFFSYLSPSDNPPFSHFNFCPSLSFSVSISPSISHHAFGVVQCLLNSYQNVSPQLWLWILNKEPYRVRWWGVELPVLKDGWRGSETWLTRQMVINDS